MPKVYVYLWLDIEDYVTKEADDTALIIVNILKKHKVPVTCKLVAEEVRALIERGRNDVVSAISDCDVGYHSDTHSRHPTVWEYLANLDVISGAKEFMSREEHGVGLMKEIFNRTPSCYGHPGVMWAPHVYPALRDIEVPVYLDETSILNLDNQPYWYCGVLNLNGAGRNMMYFDYSFEKPNGITSMKLKFNRIYERLHKGNGGAVSICFHPHTAVNKKMWDVVNFPRGLNRTKGEYERPPPQPDEVTQRAYQHFEEFIEYISSFDDLQWITASDATKIYQHQPGIVDGRRELKRVVKHFLRSQNQLKNEHGYLSPAEGFYLITTCLTEYADTGILPNHIEAKEPLGPMALTRSKGAMRMKTSDFLDAVRAANVFLNSQNFIPSNLNIGDCAELCPADFLATACSLLDSILVHGVPPDRITRIKGSRPEVDRLSLKNFKNDCKWTVLPRNFSAPKIYEQACLQAWTLKRAVPRSN